MKSSVVSAATTSTTNITGLRNCTRGSSFTKAEAIAGLMMLPLKRLIVSDLAMMPFLSKCLAGHHR